MAHTLGGGSQPPIMGRNCNDMMVKTHSYATPAAGDRGNSQLVRASDGFTHNDRYASQTPKEGVSTKGRNSSKNVNGLYGGGDQTIKSPSKLQKVPELSRTDQKKAQLNDYLAEFIRMTNNVPRAISIGNKALVCINE